MGDFYKKKYLKYKNKYLLEKKKLFGGKFNGNGTYSIVLSEPRIPFQDETYEEIKDLNEVSKILYDLDDDILPTNFETFSSEYCVLKHMIEKYPNIFIPEIFLLPIKSGPINVQEFDKNSDDVYNTKWFDYNEEIIEIMINLIDSGLPIYQITYQQGKPLKFLLNKPHLNFDKLMLNVIRGITNANNSNIYFKDLKYDNLIYVDDKIKIIDFADFFYLDDSDSTNVDLLLESFKDDIFINSIFYNVNHPISTLLLLSKSNDINVEDFYNVFNNFASDPDEKYREFVLGRFNLFKKLYGYKFTMTNVILNLFDVQENIEKQISINFDDIWHSLVILYALKKMDENTINFMCGQYDKFLVENYPIEKIIQILLRTNNRFALGFIFMEYLNKVISKDFRTIDNLIKKMIICFSTVIIKNGKVYISIHNSNNDMCKLLE